MLFRDTFRAQYYLRTLQKGSERLKYSLESLKNHFATLEITEIVDHITLQLADQLDQMLLPVIVYEIARAKALGKLAGNTPEERYDSFFIQDNVWTVEAQSLPATYPLLFEMLQIFVSLSFDNLNQCIIALAEDIASIREQLLYHDCSSLTNITILGSDRHRNGKQALLLTFVSGKKIVFKPTDLKPDLLFAEFVSALGLSSPYELHCMKAIPKNGYGWLEYIAGIDCQSRYEVGNYYRRAGVLLAVADALNYCDGHLDNLVASGPYPVLIDCETLFHAFGTIDPGLGERSILFTGLVQKPPKADSGRGFTAALQTPGVNRFEFLHTYALYDHTDEITIRYRGISDEISSNCPILHGQFQTPHEFIDEFIDGFMIAYNQISKHVEDILKRTNWWQSVSLVRARQLVRHTLYYFLLTRKIQQPESVTRRDAAIAILQPLLHSKTPSLQKLIDYEIGSLLKMDIPFFYHYPGDCNLYDGDNLCYPDYFKQSSVRELQQRFAERSPAYCKRSVEILRNILPASPISHVSVLSTEEKSI